MKDISALMRPTSVAIVGDSAGRGRGATIYDHLVTWGFDGPIYSVNPKYDELRGNRCYSSLRDIPDHVDFVASAVRADLSLDVLREAAQVGARSALFIASGFAEAGEDGRRLQEQLTALADEYEIPFCGPNCYGIANLHGRFAAYSGRVGSTTPKGSIALVFQSGALTHGILEPAPDRNVGFSYVVTTGNEASVSLSDYVNYIATDPNTRVIGCFVESFRDLSGFLTASRRAIEHGKHVVVLKVGRSERAQQAALAHTGALVGNDTLISAALRKAGVVRTNDLDEFLETLLLLDGLPSDLSPAEIALASISGGGSGVMADLAADLGLRLASFSETTTARLRQVLPTFATVNNPLDITGAVGEHPDLLIEAIETILADEAVGTLGYALNTPTFARDEEQDSAFRHSRTIQAIAEGKARSAADKPLVLFTMTSGAFDRELVDSAAGRRLPLLQGMREGLLALSRVQALARYRDASQGGVPRQMPEAVARLLERHDAGSLSEEESKELLRAAGLNIPTATLAHSAAEAVEAARKLGGPVVLKADSRDILHKTDAGVVELGLLTDDDVAIAYETIVRRASALLGPATPIRGVSVQPQVESGVDLLLGLTNDPHVGPAVTLGVGGVLTEIVRDTVTCLAPVTAAEVDWMIDQLRAVRPLLDGTRGGPACDADALIEFVVTTSWLATWLQPVLVEADINPVRVLPRGRGAVALDALFILGHADEEVAQQPTTRRAIAH